MSDQIYVVTNAAGEQVKTVRGLAGVRLWRGWTAHEVDRPAGAGETWDGAALYWKPDLPLLRAERWEAVKARRDVAEYGGCDTPSGRIDTDADSQRKISGAVQMAMIAQAAAGEFAIDWTMRDNSTVALDAPTMIAAGVAVGQHVAACHANGQRLRAMIDQAGTVDDLDKIDLGMGWPA